MAVNTRDVSPDLRIETNPPQPEESTMDGLVKQATAPSLWLENATVKVFRATDPSISLHTIPRIASTMQLAVARNGVDFFQAVVTAGASSLTSVSISVSDLKGSGTNQIGSNNVRIFLEYYINVRSNTWYESVINYELGYYPDALVPLSSPFDVAAGQNQPLWIEIKIPSSAISDTYTGTLTFSGGISGTLTFSVKVLDFVIPSKTGLFNPAYADFWELDPNGAMSESEFDSLVQTYTEFFADRDICVTDSIDFADAPMETGGTWEFSSWLDGMRPLLDGGLRNAFQPPVLRVPVDFVILGEDETTAHSTSAQNKYVDFLIEFKTFITSQAVISPDTKWYVWIDELDEPDSDNMASLIALYSNLTEQVNDEDFQFHYRVDGSIDWQSESIAIDLKTDPTDWTDLSDKFTIWLTPIEDFEFDLQYVQERLGENRKILIYQQAWTALDVGDEDIPPGFPNRIYEFPSLPGIVNPALFHRILPWFAWKYHAAGIGFWATMAWYNALTDTMVDVWTADPALWIIGGENPLQSQNGDGFLVYPGDKVQQHTGQDDVKGPVSSIRLELFRKGLEDYKYLSLLTNNQDALGNPAEQLIIDTQTVLASISSFERDYTKYDNLIYQIKELLHKNSLLLETALPLIDWNLPSESSTPAFTSGNEVTLVLYITFGAIGVTTVVIWIIRYKKR